MNKSAVGRTRTSSKKATAAKTELDLLAKVKAKIACDTRRELVEEIRARIQNGTYNVSSEEIAESIVRTLQKEREEGVR
ncbi:MAG: flagellar biosynthesis anti-sigma factor FlgM [Armatimonadota bacterium]